MKDLKFRVYFDHKPSWCDQMFYSEEEGIYGLGDWFSEVIHEQDDAPIMQYTGLQDKTGKEIYKGDIVELEAVMDYSNGYEGEVYEIDRLYIGEVVILPSKGVCLKRPKVIERNEGELWRCNYYKTIASYRSKIIGNIYERESEDGM